MRPAHRGPSGWYLFLEIPRRLRGQERQLLDLQERSARKAILRNLMRQQRQRLAPQAGTPEGRAAGGAVSRLLRGHAGLQHHALGLVALYQPIDHELDPAPIGEALQARGAALCYPRVASFRPPRLEFHRADSAGGFVRSRFGVLEPSPGSPRVAEGEAIDLFIVPGLCFDRDGQRLGYGMGFYDRALRARPGAWRVGVCHPFQMQPSLPREEHDELMDLIVTTEELIETGVRPQRTAPVEGGPR